MTPEIKALIYYAYSFGGSTRDMARLTGIPHDEVTDALIQAVREHSSADDDSDDDGDDDEQPADGESFDGGFGQGSYFQHAMKKED
jgi:hypothetical protein